MLTLNHTTNPLIEPLDNIGDLQQSGSFNLIYVSLLISVIIHLFILLYPNYEHFTQKNVCTDCATDDSITHITIEPILNNGDVLNSSLDNGIPFSSLAPLFCK